MSTERRAPAGRQLPRLWILSRSPRLYSTQRLAESARAAGALVDVVAPSQVVMGLRNRSVACSAPHVGQPDAVIPRAGSKAGRATLHVIRQLELTGCVLLNQAHAIEAVQDKWRCAQALVAAGVPVPPTAMVQGPQGLDRAAAAVGGFPLIVKLPRGAHGVGVMLAKNRAELWHHASTLWAAGQDFLLQAFIQEARGCDVRALVVGGRVVAAMQRRARKGEFRANVHQGGRTRVVSLDDTTVAIIEKAAQVLGLGLCGVDLIPGRSGPLVLEVNASPGLKGIESATKSDIARTIVDETLRRVKNRGQVVVGASTRSAPALA